MLILNGCKLCHKPELTSQPKIKREYKLAKDTQEFENIKKTSQVSNGSESFTEHKAGV